jgi:SNF2 family DNA or RNA helicase
MVDNKDSHDFICYNINGQYIRNFLIENPNKSTVEEYKQKEYKLYENEEIKDLFKTVITSIPVGKLFKHIVKNINNELYTILVLWKKTHSRLMRGDLVIFVRLLFNPIKKIVLNQKKYNKNIQYIRFIVDIIHAHMNMIETSPHYDNHKADCYVKSASNVFNTVNYDNEILKYVMKPKYYDIKYTSQYELPDTVVPELYDYQKQTIDWMICLEQEEYTTEYQKCFQYSFDNFKVIGNNLIHTETEKNFILYFCGGGLIDEMGLGKTLQVTILSLVNSDNEYNIEKDVMYDIDKIKGRGTLIICPNQLSMQWKNEIAKTIKDDDVKTLVLLSKIHFDKLTYKDLLTADFVITSFNFLANPNYVKHLPKNWLANKYSNEVFNYYDTEHFVKQGKSLVNECVETNIQVLYTKKNPLLHLIYWRRVVVDEFHEVFNNIRHVAVRKILPRICSRYRWCVTGTPFTDNHDITKTVQFLTNNYSIDNSILNNKCVRETLKMLFRRNTKLSVEKELKLSSVKYICKWLEFSPEENNMYVAYLTDSLNSKFDEYLRKLCCHPNLSKETKTFLNNCATLSSIENKMSSYYQTGLEEVQTKQNNILLRITAIKLNLYSLGEKMKFPDDFDPEEFKNTDYKFMDKKQKDIHIAKYYTELNQVEEEQKKIIKEIDGKQRSLTFYKNIVKDLELKKTLDMCSICLSDMSYDNIAITICSHLFCFTCMQEACKTIKDCPNCKTLLGPDKFFKLITKQDTKNNSTDLSKMINKIGTKPAHLISYLKKYKDRKTILFSQWDDLLTQIGQLLSEYKISNLFCRGNFAQRSKAISRFNNDDDTQVIMLSLVNSASGTNLTSASQVILLDSVNGTPEYARDVENQAIARAIRLGQKNKYVKVIRFLIKNTIEEEIYNTQHPAQQTINV